MRRPGRTNEPQYLPPSVRRLRIESIVEERGFARVRYLAHVFGVSEVTIRNDLEALAKDGQVERVQGGAIPGPSSLGSFRSYAEAEWTKRDEKSQIGRKAASLVSSGDVLMLDSGTTVDALAQALVDRTDLSNVMVVTNALNVALKLEQAFPQITVIVTGGTLRPAQHALVNPLADAIFENVSADIAFIGCNGVSCEGGITNMEVTEAEMKRLMLDSADRRVVLADSGKIGERTPYRTVRVENVDTVITGSVANPEQLELLREAGLEILIA